MSSHDEIKLKRISPRIPEQLHRELKLASIEKGVTMEQAVVQAVQEWVVKNGNHSKTRS